MERSSIHRSASHLAITAGAGLGAMSFIQVYLVGARIQGFGLASSSFPGALTGSLIGTGITPSQTSIQYVMLALQKVA